MGCGSSRSESDRHSGVWEPHGEDEQLLDRFKLGKKLGEGSFGVVFVCKKKGSKEEYAVKMIDQVESTLEEIQLEVDMLKRLAHPCVMKLYDVYYEKVFVCMVLKLYRGGNLIFGLQLHWKQKGLVPTSIIQNISKMMFQAVAWLHKHQVIHRDLKGDNYLMDHQDIRRPETRVYLADFGTVRELPQGQRLRERCGTTTYWGPEFYLRNYGLKVDIWALGVVVFGMVNFHFPFQSEEDVNKKVIKVPLRIGKDGQSFVMGLLERKESKRLSAKQALDHSFLASIKSSAEVQEPWDDSVAPALWEPVANVGVEARRLELVGRLESAAVMKERASCGAEMSAGRSVVNTDLLYEVSQVNRDFETVDQRAERTVRFQWWTPEQCAAANFVDERRAVLLKEEASAVDNEERIRRQLESHFIPTSKFGRGQAKHFVEFVNEIQAGEARLMLDASKYKSIVRVVDLVLLRVVHGQGEARRYLVETAERYPDGRTRRETNQLVGAKKLPYENGVATAMRILKDRLNLTAGEVALDFLHSENYEEDEESPSYPGVRTVYRKEIFEGVIVSADAEALRRVGLEGSGSFQKEDEKQYVHFYSWMSDEECSSKKVALRAPAGCVVSPLVQPPIGLDQEQLHCFLEANKVDVTKFGKDGANTIREFSDELIRGEAALVRRPDNSLIRVVDVLILQVARADGRVLVEVEEAQAEARKELKRLPAVKRRTDENMFLAAQRVLNKVLKFNENLVAMDHSSVRVIEEETTSDYYAGLPTLYRRRIVRARLLEDGPFGSSEEFN